jgi:CCR4-NOT transcription complex subunit 1
VQQLQLNKMNASASAQQMNQSQLDVQIETATELFRNLVMNSDTEGRYLLLNAIANQLRYPNNHTHYFSFIILYLFSEANQEIVQEQITRVLLERLIVNRPHPWGLLITFIELIKVWYCDSFQFSFSLILDEKGLIQASFPSESTLQFLGSIIYSLCT